MCIVVVVTDRNIFQVISTVADMLLKEISCDREEGRRKEAAIGFGQSDRHRSFMIRRHVGLASSL